MEQQESRSLQARMRRSFTQDAQQPFLRAKDCIMKTATSLQENAEDIYAEAKGINEERAAAEEAVEDVAENAEETADEDAFKEAAEETKEAATEETAE